MKKPENSKATVSPKAATSGSGAAKVVGFREFVDTFRAVGRGERSAPEWAGKVVYASEKAKSFWNQEKNGNVESLFVFAKLISENKDLLEEVRLDRWSSVAELAKSIGRAESNVSRSLGKLEKFGMISLVAGTGRSKRPTLSMERISLEVDAIKGLVVLSPTIYSSDLEKSSIADKVVIHKKTPSSRKVSSSKKAASSEKHATSANVADKKSNRNLKLTSFERR